MDEYPGEYSGGLNGEEALEVFEKEKIDVLLTDINMPFMDGIELLSRIHEEYPGTETVIFSGYDEFSYAKRRFLTVFPPIF